MRLIYVTARLPFGIREEYLVDEIRCLQMLGHAVLLVPRSTEKRVFHEERRELLPSTRSVPLLGREVLLTAVRAFWKSPRRIVKLLADYRKSRSIRIFLQNLAVFPKAIWLAAVAREWQADGFLVHWGTTPSTMVMTAARLSGIPWMMTVHRGDIVKNNLLGEKIMRADRVRFISESARHLAMKYVAVPPGKGQVIHMGVVVPEAVSIVVRRPLGTLRILCPAMLVSVKGHIHLLRAVALLRRTHKRIAVTLAGDGPLRGRLERIVKDLDLQDSVRFTGYLPHDWLRTMYAVGEVDLVILPSVDLGNGLHEGIPVALIEAMGYGIPVIATRTGGIPELLKDGAGILVDPEDPMGLAEAVLGLSLNPGLLAVFGRKGRERVAAEFNGMIEAEKIAGAFTRKAEGQATGRLA